jgi:ubiquitin-conjugating enzyme E2 Q
MARLTVTELIAKIADIVRPFTSGTSTNPISLDSDEDEYEAGHDDSASEIDGDDFEVGSDSDDMFANIPEINLKTKLQPHINQAELSGFTREQMRELLRARIGGFRVGAHTKMTAAAPFPVVCISVRIRHLEISEGALLAWDLNPDHYVVMLMRYGHGYRSFKRLVEGAASQTGIQFRLGVCKRYKPSPEDACAAFEDRRTYGIIGDLPEDANTDVTVNGKKTTFEHFFLSEPLKDIMNQKFISLLKIRDTYGVDWDGAIRFLKAREADPDRALLPSDIHQTEAELASGGTSLRTDIPGFIAADEVTDSFKEHASFPLQAMQFAMKYLVSCTKFCLICHDPTDETVEALKPYVCQKPLCLYQYMNHGFGPSIEHEIISRPFVVDLLVSFCFAAASAMQLRSYPDGMGLCMPRNPPPVVLGAPGDQPVASAEHGCYDVYFIDSGIVDTYHISLGHLECSAVVRVGDWVALKAFSGK